MYENLDIVDELDVSESVRMDEYISNNLPWLPTRMDFSKIENHSHLSWGSETDEEVEKFITSSFLSSFEYVVVLYSATENLNIFTLKYAARELDYIAKGKETFVLFGIERLNGSWRIDISGLVYAHTGRDIWLTNNGLNHGV